MIVSKMNEEVKLWFNNGAAITISFTNVVDVLKIGILLVSLAYTCVKLWYLITDRRNNKK